VHSRKRKCCRDDKKSKRKINFVEQKESERFKRKCTAGGYGVYFRAMI
jgi:hypothetical protein